MWYLVVNHFLPYAGRTFPSHPYFANSQKQGGQATLRRMLHAYAVTDSDTGYCQGISFVAGMILMHVSSEDWKQDDISFTWF